MAFGDILKKNMHQLKSASKNKFAKNVLDNFTGYSSKGYFRMSS